jgi:tetratricopeptide (TPR) repeat protein
MKRIVYLTVFALGLAMFSSCEDTFLQKPDTTGMTDLETVFSSSKNAEAALMICYRQVLVAGWPGGLGLSHGTLDNISSERVRGSTWHSTYKIANAGLNSTGSGMSSDNFDANWRHIRACFIVKENIDKVPDMSDQDKAYIKAEIAGLVAHKYLCMFYRYGGVPIVRKSLEASDDLTYPRTSLQETLSYFLELCSEAIAGLPEGDWEPGRKGRLTRGAVLAMKARALLFAARPLFNASTPYMSMTDPADNRLICFGNKDASRWQEAIAANEAVIDWAYENGYYLVKTGALETQNSFEDAVKDFGTATSTPSNAEVILAYKNNSTSTAAWSWACNMFRWYNTWQDWSGENLKYDTDNMGLTTNQLERFYKKDGTDQNWPKAGDSAPRANDWADRLSEMEARCRLGYIFPGDEVSLSNPGVSVFISKTCGKPVKNGGTFSNFPNVYNSGLGPRSQKFYYRAGSNRVWFEPPIFRLAETYLNLAEAYNESGNSSLALKNLNIVHYRAGLPAVTETEYGKLRKIIQRERSVELTSEGHYYFDAKHCMIDNIADGGLCGPVREFQYYVISSANDDATKIISYWDAVTYVAFWAPYMYLEPIPDTEIVKGIVKQNPGY